MKASEFEVALEHEFGSAYGAVVATDLSLAALGGRTARRALADGQSPRAVWEALCAATDVPPSRRSGVGLADPPR